MTSINNSFNNPINPALIARQEKLAAASALPDNAAAAPQNAAAAREQTADRVELNQEIRRAQVSSTDKTGTADYKRASANQQQQLDASRDLAARRAAREQSAAAVTREPGELQARLRSETTPEPLEAERQAQYSPDARAAAAREELDLRELPLPQSELAEINVATATARRQELETRATAAYNEAQEAAQVESVLADARDRFESTVAAGRGVNTPALRELTSAVRVREAAAAQEAAPELAAANETLTAVNREVADIDTQVRAARAASEDTVTYPDNAAANQRVVDQALEKTNAAIDRVRVRTADAKGIGAGELSELNSVLEELGATRDPASDDRADALTFRDLREGGRAAQASNAELAAEISGNASRQLAAVRNTVDTLEGNLASVTGTTANAALRGMDRFVQDLGNQELAQAAMRNVVAALETSPADVIAEVSGNLNPAAAEPLLNEQPS